MLLPYKVDVPTERWALSNWLIIILATGAFLLQATAEYTYLKPFILSGWSLKGMIGHIWLHADFPHLFGNMLFLWVFGNAVCAKIGNLTYIPAYIGLGLIAAALHNLAGGGDVIGASGAINGVVGMYLVFYPRNDISVLFFMIPIIRTFSISSFWIIIMWFIFDIWGALKSGDNVAHFAHLGGFAGGFTLAVLLLRFDMVRMNNLEESLLDIFHLNRKQRTEKKKSVENEPDDSNQGWTHIPLPKEINMGLETIAPQTTKKQETIRFACTCGKTMRIAQTHAGKKGKCPNCGKTLTIPTTSI